MQHRHFNNNNKFLYRTQCLKAFIILLIGKLTFGIMRPIYKGLCKSLQEGAVQSAAIYICQKTPGQTPFLMISVLGTTLWAHLKDKAIMAISVLLKDTSVKTRIQTHTADQKHQSSSLVRST